MRKSHDTLETRVGRRRFRISYTRPSFLEGMARVLDIGGTMDPEVEILHDRRDTGKTDAELDAQEIREVWAEVGQYLYDAMGRFDQEMRQSGEKRAEDKE